MWDAHDKLKISKQFNYGRALDDPTTYRTFRH